MQDVAGERTETYAVFDGVGSGLSKKLLWIIIGSVVGGLLVIGLVAGITVWWCKKKSYNSVSTRG